MPEASKDQDQSMEDILQSIKRIIADEDDVAAPASTGSDVLELTEILAEEAAPPKIDEPITLPDLDAPAPEPAMPAPEPAPEPMMEAAPPAAPAGAESLLSEEALSASLAALNPLKEPPPAPKAEPIETPVFRSGATVEDLVVESLKPMLKAWLDTNLPQIVQELVEREVRKLRG